MDIIAAMHYLKHDTGYGSVQAWAIQHRHSITPLAIPLERLVAGTGVPLVVSSIVILSASELATIFSGDSRLVAVAEKIDTRRTTVMGDIHWNTLRLLAGTFGAWATASPVDSSKSEDVEKLRAERDSLRERMAAMTMDLVMLRNRQATATTVVSDDAQEILPAVTAAEREPERTHEPIAGDAPVLPLSPTEFLFPEGPALWTILHPWFCEKFPLQSAFLDGVKLVQSDDDSLFLSAPAELPPAVVASIEDGLMQIGGRHRECFVMVEPAADNPETNQPGPAKPEAEQGDASSGVPEPGGVSGSVPRNVIVSDDQSDVPDGLERVIVPDGIKGTDIVDESKLFGRRLVRNPSVLREKKGAPPSHKPAAAAY